MEAQKPKIALYVQRSFGEKLTATFDFIKENWKPLMKVSSARSLFPPERRMWP